MLADSERNLKQGDSLLMHTVHVSHISFLFRSTLFRDAQHVTQQPRAYYMQDAVITVAEPPTRRCNFSYQDKSQLRSNCVPILFFFSNEVSRATESILKTEKLTIFPHVSLYIKKNILTKEVTQFIFFLLKNSYCIFVSND